jgi:hypothetical protein
MGNCAGSVFWMTLGYIGYPSLRAKRSNPSPELDRLTCGRLRHASLAMTKIEIKGLLRGY